MSVIPTRDEFEGLVVALLNCESDAEWHKRCGTYDDATIAAMERRDEARAALFAAHDAQAARIAELEAAIDALTLSGADCYALVLELEEREEKYRIRIAELEAALAMIRSEE